MNRCNSISFNNGKTAYANMHFINLITHIKKELLNPHQIPEHKREVYGILAQILDTALFVASSKSLQELHIIDKKCIEFGLHAQITYLNSLPLTGDVGEQINQAIYRSVEVRERQVEEIKFLCEDRVYKAITHLRELLENLKKSKLNQSSSMPSVDSITSRSKFGQSTRSFPTTIDESSFGNILKEIESKLLELHLSPDFSGIHSRLASNKLSRQVDVILSKVINMNIFLKKAERLVEVNKFQIAQHLLQLQDCPKDVTLLRIGFLSKEAETHNGGRRPLEFDLKVDKNEIKAVLKPRRADVDKAMYATFQRLNEIQDDRLPLLPNCIIIHLEEDWLDVEDLEDISIWEFKEGKTIRELAGNLTQNPWDFLESKAIGSLRIQMRRLAAIFRYAKVIDQHVENIMVIDNQATLFPCDLEALADAKSGLGVSEKKFLNLIEDEESGLFF